jgi:hypothetical protein
MRVLLVSLVLASTMLLASDVAYADVAPPETIACAGKRAGDACTDAVSGAAGACKDETCTSAKPNGASSSYACLMCVPGAASDGGCAIVTSSQVRHLGAWAVAGLFPLLFLLARRRRR